VASENKFRVKCKFKNKKNHEKFAKKVKALYEFKFDKIKK